MNNQLNTQTTSTQIDFYFEHESIEDLLYEFLKDRTPLTEKAYRKDLKDFFSFTFKEFSLPRVVNRKVRFDEIRRVHIVKFKKFLETNNSLRRKPYAPNSINRKISSISSFFIFLFQREIVPRNPAEYCIRPKRTVLTETQAFSDREMKNLFELVIEEAPPLHRAVILLLFTTGMRQAELRGLKLENFINREGITFVSYMGKCQRKNEMPVHPTTVYYLDEYLKWMHKIGRNAEKEDFLFQPTKNSYDGKIKKRLSHTAVGYIVEKWAKKINPNKRITPHSARATFISSLLDSGEDIYYVSQLVNHANVNITQRYNKRKRNFRKNPVFGINFF